eukprot:TRINITY_DN105936_c0_g1_i1.p1 TRINITY_DN105936_c0_g1~~TRINITY_DN105936_c0_g1_i1.p1  ORF type:complete len:329 (+),score=1.79 TRINITY_DN105936_c0_g1_i1:143-988(+)
MSKDFYSTVSFPESPCGLPLPLPSTRKCKLVFKRQPRSYRESKGRPLTLANGAGSKVKSDTLPIVAVETTNTTDERTQALPLVQGAEKPGSDNAKKSPCLRIKNSWIFPKCSKVTVMPHKDLLKKYLPRIKALTVCPSRDISKIGTLFEEVLEDLSQSAPKYQFVFNAMKDLAMSLSTNPQPESFSAHRRIKSDCIFYEHTLERPELNVTGEALGFKSSGNRNAPRVYKAYTSSTALLQYPAKNATTLNATLPKKGPAKTTSMISDLCSKTNEGPYTAHQV